MQLDELDQLAMLVVRLVVELFINTLLGWMYSAHLAGFYTLLSLERVLGCKLAITKASTCLLGCTACLVACTPCYYESEC